MRKMKPSYLLVYLLLWIQAFVSIYPVVWMAFYSLKTNEEIFVTNPFGFPKEPVWSNYGDALEQLNIPVYFKNSFVIAIISVVLGIICSLTFTYVVARVKTRFTSFLKTMVVAGMFIPIQAVMTPLIIMVKNLGLSNTIWSLIVPYMALNFPFAVMVLYGFYRSLPIDLEESAYLEGCGFFRTYFSIIMPQMKSIISVLVIYLFINSWNEFSLALILITKDSMKTLPLGLSSFYGQYTTNWGLLGAALMIASIPVIIIYLIFSNRISDAMTYSGMKG